MGRRAPKATEPAEVGRRARQKRDKLERLRAAAWELFSTKGFEETTTREIAERAGVATGTLFLYAKDKPDLLFLVFEHRLAETVDDAFRSLPNASLKTQLIHVLGRLFVMYEKSPALARRFVKELPGADGPNAQRVNGLTFVFLQRLGGLVEKAAERGEVRKGALPLLAAQTIFAIYFMGLLSWLSGFNSLETALDTAISGALDLLMEGLAEKRES
jgi:TetR/AcrR family transcriptional regulator, cholesterol catabolism regulator